MTGIVDAHTHVLLPPTVMDRVRELFEGMLGNLFAYGPEPAAVLDALAAEGVTQVWALPYAHRADTSRRFNIHSAAAAVDLGNRGVEIVPGCTTHPDEADPAAIVAEAVDDLGCAVLKLHCSVGGFLLDDPRLHEALVVADERGVPVVVHAGHDVSGRSQAHELAPLDRVATALPTLKLVVAHCAAPDTDAALVLLDRHPSVHADLTPVVQDPVALSRDDLLAHADRLLFGSDAPNTALRVTDLVAGLDALDLPETVREDLLGGNARRLLTRTP